jgi:hypothetical protein
MSNFQTQLAEMEASLKTSPNASNKTRRDAVQGDRQPSQQSTNSTASTQNISAARESALALSVQSHKAMTDLQSAGLNNAAAYIQRKATERAAIVDKASEAIALMLDPDLLESDIMNAAAVKVAARSDAWNYTETIDLDVLFAPPVAGLLGVGS